MDTGKILHWFKKIGVIGFLFFLLKGIAWLVVGYFAADVIV